METKKCTVWYYRDRDKKDDVIYKIFLNGQDKDPLVLPQGEEVELLMMLNKKGVKLIDRS